MQVLYDLAIRLSFNASGLTAGIPVATRALANLQARIASTTGATAQLNRGLGLIAGGMALFAGGMAGARVLGGWIENAGRLETAMANVRMASQGTAAQLAALENVTFDISAKTRFSALDVSNFEAQAASLGLNNRTVLLSVIPQLANLAEVDQALRKIAPKESISASIAIAQTLGAVPTVDRSGRVNHRQLAQFNALLDLSSRAELVSGLSPNQLARSVSRMAPYGATLGMTPTDIISSISLAARVGLISGAGGASRLAAIFRTITPTLRPGIRNEALSAVERVGGGHFFKNGSFQAAGGFVNTLNIVERFLASPQARRNQERALQLLNQAFLVTGSQAFSVLARPSSIKAYQSIQNLLGPTGLPSTPQNQQTLYETFQGQMRTFHSNLTDISTVLGRQLLPVVLPVLRAFVELTNAVRNFLVYHSDIAQFIAIFALVATAASLIAAPVLVAAGAFGILSAAGIVTAGTFLPFTAAVVGVVAAIAGATWVFTHWGQVIAFLTHPLGALTGQCGVIGQVIAGLLIPVGLLVAPFVALGLAIAHVITWVGGFAGIGRTIGDALGIAFQPISLAVDAIKKLMVAYQSLMDVLHPATTTKVTEAFAHPGANTAAGAKGHSWATAGGGWGTPPHARALTHPVTRVDHPRTIVAPPRSGWEWITGVHARTTETFVHHHPVSHPVPHHTPTPPLIPHKSGGMALIGGGSLHATTHQTTEVHHHHHGSPVSIAINGADHATSNDLATVVAKRVRHEITASARWHNRYHGKGLLNMEPT